MLGAGAVGTAIAVTLQSAGYAAVLTGTRDASAASRVAGGMIAPVLEARIDLVSGAHFQLFAASADLWPDFARSYGIDLRRGGALWLAPEADRLASPEMPQAPGRESRAVSLAEARALCPDLTGWTGPITHVSGEACIDPRQALAGMERQFLEAGGVRLEGLARPDGSSWRIADRLIQAERVVVAPGYPDRQLAALAPELGLLSPIRGRIARVAAHLDPDTPCIRGPGVYVAPQADGSAMVGATMEFAEAEPIPDHAVAANLVATAARFMPRLAQCAFEPLVGVRAESPDHLPMIGASRSGQLWLAAGLRRNGWLLAPLAARTIGAYLAGEDPGAIARALDPRRFADCGSSIAP